MKKWTIDKFIFIRLLMAVALGGCFGVSFKIFFSNPHPEWQAPLYAGFSLAVPIFSSMFFLISAWILFSTNTISRSRLVVLLWLIFALMAVIDLNSWQPWAYIFIVWLSLEIFLAGRTGLFFLSSVYVFSALQKLNPFYFSQANQFFPWIDITPEFAATFSILVELSMGLGFLFGGPVCKMAFIGIILMHAYIALTLHFSHSSDWIVYPWSILMICMLWFSLNSVSQKTLHGNAKKFVFGLVLILPTLSFFTSWPSYLSFSFYSFNTDRAQIELPASLQHKYSSSISGDSMSGNKFDLQNIYLDIYGNTPFSHPFVFKILHKNFCQLYPEQNFQLEVVSRWSAFKPITTTYYSCGD